MRILVAVIMAAGLAMSAYAQGIDVPGSGGGMGRRGAQKQIRSKAQDKNVPSPLEKLPDKPFDPWGGVREAPKSKSK